MFKRVVLLSIRELALVRLLTGQRRDKHGERTQSALLTLLTLLYHQLEKVKANMMVGIV